MTPQAKDNLNGIGVILRFITPILITLILYIISGIKEDIKDLKVDMKNHLCHHQELEVNLEKRLSTIEAILKGR
jgi:hypothetical protein